MTFGPGNRRRGGAAAVPLSYVLVAETRAQVHEVAQWLRAHPISPQVEIVLAAPAAVMTSLPARLVPARVRATSVANPPNRNAIKMAGAAATTGLVVIVIDCEDDFAVRLRDPFAANPVTGAEPGTDLHKFLSEIDGPTVMIRNSRPDLTKPV